MAEFITGGGCAGGALPESLAREGGLMVGALVRDLASLGLAPTVLRDARLPALPGARRTVWVEGAEGFEQAWERELPAHDLALPVAPESDGALERLTLAAERAGTALWSPASEAVRTGASKLASVRALAGAGVPVVATVQAGAPLPPGPLGWVVKPDDGVGCEGQRLVAPGRLPGPCGPGRWVVQPLEQGRPASLTLLCARGEAGLLAANLQEVERLADGFRLRGVRVNALWRERQALEPLARAVVRALPGLRGCVGVDLVLGPDGPKVLEVNPRLTTAYAALQASLGRNPMGLVREALAGGCPRTLAAGGEVREVRVRVDAEALPC